MGDWQDLGQAVVVGLIFSYLVAKLISTVISFRQDHLRVARDKDHPVGETSEADKASEEGNEENAGDQSSSLADDDRYRVRDDGFEGLVTEESHLGEDDDDWEGIESTELDEMFGAASAFVATTAADRNSTKVSNDVQLQLYAFYKIATEGPCIAPQPSAIKVTARAKWNAWQKLGAMPPEEAMQKYIETVEMLFPSWSSGLAKKNEHEDASSSSSATQGTMGPVFSSLILEEGSENDLRLDAIHDSAREGEVDSLLKNIENGVSVDLRDSEGRTPLHWAVDRGHLKIVEILLSKSADVNAKDNEGQTSLHYAVICEREDFAELLVKNGADTEIKDNDGNSPIDLCSSPWNFMTPAK
ncbi:acyl-CoA-binding domain-containing protein 1-like [Phalaenopsis equestris]|uniref:acyl-CoA-binding domain-containing protein 1-like n=1 Tax=Phalaenopsis equestris TaxID=78828 RepID=UPI0009E469ED|nr:acyl-CoA-binding domain-containing protein 1-like [Phalaenopsis equestris]